jgi:peptide deformylase
MPEKLRIFTYPNAILRKKSELVQNILDKDIQTLIDNMAETMYSAITGIGLAAIQIGKPLQIIVYDLNAQRSNRDYSVLINPEIITASGSTAVAEESCLSLLGFSAEVTRSTKIVVKGINRTGNLIVTEADGLLARCLQHEIDHLNGILLVDHYVGRVKKS